MTDSLTSDHSSQYFSSHLSTVTLRAKKSLGPLVPAFVGSYNKPSLLGVGTTKTVEEVSYDYKYAYAFALNFCLGVGVLGLPQQFYKAGWIASTFILLFSSIFSYFATNWLIDTMARAEGLIQLMDLSEQAFQQQQQREAHHQQSQIDNYYYSNNNNNNNNNKNNNYSDMTGETYYISKNNRNKNSKTNEAIYGHAMKKFTKKNKKNTNNTKNCKNCKKFENQTGYNRLNDETLHGTMNSSMAAPQKGQNTNDDYSIHSNERTLPQLKGQQAQQQSQRQQQTMGSPFIKTPPSNVFLDSPLSQASGATSDVPPPHVLKSALTELSSFYGISPTYRITNRKFEVNQLLGIFYGNFLRRVYELLTCLYIISACWSYTSVFASALAEQFSIHIGVNGINLDSCNINDYSGDSYLSDCRELYNLFVIVYAMMVIPLSCMNITEQKYVQVAMTMLRYVVVFTMVGVCMALVYSNLVATDDNSNSNGDDVGINYDKNGWKNEPGINKPHFGTGFSAFPKNIGSIFGLISVASLAVVYQHGVPALSQPVEQKHLLSYIYLAVSASCFVLLSF